MRAVQSQIANSSATNTLLPAKNKVTLGSIVKQEDDEYNGMNTQNLNTLSSPC